MSAARRVRTGRIEAIITLNPVRPATAAVWGPRRRYWSGVYRVPFLVGGSPVMHIDGRTGEIVGVHGTLPSWRRGRCIQEDYA